MVLAYHWLALWNARFVFRSHFWAEKAADFESLFEARACFTSLFQLTAAIVEVIFLETLFRHQVLFLLQHDESAYLDIVPALVDITEQIISRKLPSQFDYHTVPSPWLTITILKLLATLGKAEERFLQYDTLSLQCPKRLDILFCSRISLHHKLNIYIHCGPVNLTPFLFWL